MTTEKQSANEGVISEAVLDELMSGYEKRRLGTSRGTPDAATERLRRLVARRYQVVRHRTRLKNEVHAILHAHLIPKCPHSDPVRRVPCGAACVLIGARVRCRSAR